MFKKRIVFFVLLIFILGNVNVLAFNPETSSLSCSIVQNVNLSFNNQTMIKVGDDLKPLPSDLKLLKEKLNNIKIIKSNKMISLVPFSNQKEHEKILLKLYDLKKEKTVVYILNFNINKNKSDDIVKLENPFNNKG